MKFWNITEKDGLPEIRIEGPIQMDKSLWAYLLDLPEQTAPGIREDIQKMAGKDICVYINSGGGECIAASVLYTALMEHKGRVTVKIDGQAVSAASVIAMAGDEILMSPTSVMMIHNPLTVAAGEVKDMEKAIEILSEVKETILNAYVKKTGRNREEISKMMDEETWMSPKKAIEMGFADGILEGEALEESVQNGILSGAKMVYNRLPDTGIQEISRILNATDSKKKERETALHMIEIDL